VPYVSQPPPSDRHDESQDAGNDAGSDQDTPMGAIVVTVFLAATILVFWFGMYFLNLQRG